MKSDREILLRYLDGSLSSDHVQKLEQRLEKDNMLQRELSQLQAIEQTMSGAKADAFGAFFVDKALKALHLSKGTHGLTLYDSLQWAFLRTAAAGMAIVMLLSLLNLLDYQGLYIASNWFDAAFGLPSASIEDAFAFGFI